MRISLKTQITAALVLFGLVPASIVAWFAYKTQRRLQRRSNEAHRISSRRGHAARRIGNVCPRFQEKSRLNGEGPTEKLTDGGEDAELKTSDRGSRRGIQPGRCHGQGTTAQVFVVDAPTTICCSERSESGNMVPEPRRRFCSRA